jgi:hypothetical protein
LEEAVLELAGEAGFVLGLMGEPAGDLGLEHPEGEQKQLVLRRRRLRLARLGRPSSWRLLR